jgi:zinc protease
LKNGLKVHVIPRPELPLVSLHLILPFGAEADPPGRGGLADLSADMLTRGTRKRSAQQLAGDVDALGALFSCNSGWDGTSIYVSGLSEDLDRLLALLLEVYTEPAFSAEEFEQLKQRRIAQLV